MLGFVVPIKPRSVSKDWTLEMKLLERTAKSICGQTSEEFRMIIVFNEKPEISFVHQNIIYVEYPFPPVSLSQIEDYQTLVKNYYSGPYAERMMDKGKKIHYGCKIGMDLGCDYLMAIDSDDLISNRIAEFVRVHASKKMAGWRITKGFIYEDGSSVLVKKYDIQNINGSTHIIRKDLITIPDFSSNLFWNYNLFEAHGYTYYRIKEFHNELLADYPFFGVIYIVNKNNYSNILKLTKTNTIKNLIKKIIRGRLKSKSICDEFSLYQL